MAFNKGDILLPSTKVSKDNWLNGLYHPAVLWDETYNADTDFCGIMITHSPPKGRFANVLMAKSHFENGYAAGFSKTHFVNQIFVKFYNWGPFELVGKLTPEGVAFIEGQLNPDSLLREFVEYRDAMKN